MDQGKNISEDQHRLHADALEAAVQAAHEAARVIEMHAGRIRGSSIRSKGVHDLLTEVDEESQRIIIKHLSECFPDFGVLAEEGEAAFGPASFRGYRWIIDPIDGTTNFTRGIPPYAVSIGLQHDDRMVVGVVLDVAHGELFTAIRGGGLFVNGRRAHVTDTSDLDECVLTTGFPYRAFGSVDAYLQVMRRFMKEARAIRRPGSASVDLAWVAAGRFDGFFETGLRPWDVAAGSLLVEEGGGRVSDYRDNPDAVFSSQVVASNGLIHASMLDVVAPLRDATA